MALMLGGHLINPCCKMAVFKTIRMEAEHPEAVLRKAGSSGEEAHLWRVGRLPKPGPRPPDGGRTPG